MVRPSFAWLSSTNSLSGGWVCQGCNTETQGEVPLVLACAYPDEYHLMEEKDRESVRMSADLCLISGKTPKHFVRGLLEMPLLLDGLSQGMRELAPFVLTWGVWVAVSQVDFDLHTMPP